MKSTLRYLLPTLALAAALPALRADDETVIEKKSGDGSKKIERRVIINHGGHGEKESVAFLGVSTGPVSDTLVEQLGLQKGFGLVVNDVVADSPAAGVLKRHDVLLKFEDQRLIDPRQFSVLVRNQKEGDEVTLTYVRAGKQATVKVKLAKHDVPKQLGLMMGGAGAGFEGFPGGSEHMRVLVGPERDDVNHVLSLMHDGGQQNVRVMRMGNGPAMRSIAVNTGNSNMVFNDERGALELTIKDGQKNLVAKNEKGDVLFSGPINTPEERQKLSDELRGRLEKIEIMDGFDFKTDGNVEVDSLTVAPHKVRQPLTPGVPLRRGLPQGPQPFIF